MPDQDAKEFLTDTLHITVNNLRGRTWTGVRRHYVCPEDFVLQQGAFYEPQVLPKQYPLLESKQCFDNAFRLALDHAGDLNYVEGFATVELCWPFHHAWCADKDGRVIEPTWRNLGDLRQAAYMGVSFPLELVNVIRFITRTFPVLLGDSMLLFEPYVSPELTTRTAWAIVEAAAFDLKIPFERSVGMVDEARSKYSAQIDFVRYSLSEGLRRTEEEKASAISAGKPAEEIRAILDNKRAQ